MAAKKKVTKEATPEKKTVKKKKKEKKEPKVTTKGLMTDLLKKNKKEKLTDVQLVAVLNESFPDGKRDETEFVVKDVMRFRSRFNRINMEKDPKRMIPRYDEEGNALSFRGDGDGKKKSKEKKEEDKTETADDFHDDGKKAPAKKKVPAKRKVVKRKPVSK